MKKPLLVLFDGNAIVHRAFHAFGATKYREATPLTVSKTGEVVSAVYGFALMLLKAINDLQPTHCAVAFDRKGPTFRHQLYDSYKAHRPPTPAELVAQIGRVKELVAAFDIPAFELDGYEADDILGALSHQAGRREIDTVIVTGDGDTMQLVSEHVKVLYPKQGRSFSDTILYGAAEVSQKYGVGPEHIADLKGLEGDSSDNIPGVPGVGAKTAVKLIQQFGSIEQIYEHIGQVTPARVQELLRQHEDMARQSKVLATIVTGTPVTLNLDDCRVARYDRHKVAELFRELEFTRLLPRLPRSDTDEAGNAPAPVEVQPLKVSYYIVSSRDDLDKLVSRLSSVKSVAFDTETTGLNPMTAQLVGISLSPAAGESYYIPVGHTVLSEVPQLPLEQVIGGLRQLFEESRIAKIAHHAKYDMAVLAQCGLDVNNVTFDSMIAAHLLGEPSAGLKALAFSKLGIEMTAISELIGTGAKQVPMSQVDIKMTADYACADADMTIRLAGMLDGELRRQGLWQLFADVEMPLVPVLQRMEANGIALDTALLGEMSGQLGEKLQALEKEIYQAADHEFNINSPQQLSKVLFEELGLPAARRGKASPSTGASILEGLEKQGYAIASLILEYRQLAKVKSTYIDALPRLVNPGTGRLHTSFNQTRTATGRLSSSDPNLQNIPIRGDLGRQVRRAFIAPPGAYLLAGDYSQIDLRVLAEFSKDEGLLSAFRHDEDIHAATAAQLFDVPPAEVTGDMRRLAKTVNFGVIYGMSEYGLEQATELSREEAGKFIKAYFEKYPGVKQYLEATREQARQSGYVQTLLGRRRFIPEISVPNRQVREAAERMAINMPVQGTSADIIKVAMINLQKEMDKQELKSRMLLQVHDELVFEVPEDECEIMRRLVPDMMSDAVKLSIPLKVDIKEGSNWGEMK
ncbi:DNA polymerase I [Chloroflexota bacterium]